MKFKIGDKVIVKKFREFIGDEPTEKPKDYHSKLFYGKILTVTAKTWEDSTWEIEVSDGSKNLCVMRDQISPAYFTKTELYIALEGNL